MLIDQINLNHVRIFETVFRTGSMTLAAQELSLTQSGVSQHIKSLEDVLDIQLFDRINQRLVPTAQAVVLYENCNLGLMNIEKALSQVTGRDTQLSGTVSIGMPIEFGINMVMPRLAEFAKKNPFIKYRLRLDFANEMNEGLLRGDIDFAFVDEFTMDRRITVEKVYDECLELCIATEVFKDREKKLGSKLTRQFFEGLDYIDYQQGEPILRMWFAHHLKAKNIELNMRAFVMDVQGLSKLILSGLGAGILPSHYVEKLLKDGEKVHVFKGSGKPLQNAISVAYLEQRSHSQATLAVLESLRAWFKQKS